MVSAAGACVIVCACVRYVCFLTAVCVCGESSYLWPCVTVRCPAPQQVGQRCVDAELSHQTLCSPAPAGPGLNLLSGKREVTGQTGRRRGEKEGYGKVRVGVFFILNFLKQCILPSTGLNHHQVISSQYSVLTPHTLVVMLITWPKRHPS